MALRGAKAFVGVGGDLELDGVQALEHGVPHGPDAALKEPPAPPGSFPPARYGFTGLTCSLSSSRRFPLAR